MEIVGLVFVGLVIANLAFWGGVIWLVYFLAKKLIKTAKEK